MIVEPKVRGFICTTAHPVGCRENVRRQIEYVRKKARTGGPKRVLVVGSSTGYGLASRIELAFSSGAATLGVMFERPASGKRTASAGWYNTAAFEEFAHADGLYAKTINGDAFSREVKEQAAAVIAEDMGQVDMVVYSLAAPRRTLADGTKVSSVLKTTGEDYTNKNIDLAARKITEVTVTPATEQEIADTVKVMGGEDWKAWIRALTDADAIEEDAVTFAYSYIGPELTYPIYFEGTIGAAKKHLHKTAGEISEEFKENGISAYISVNKGLVTQASSAIPIVPLYMAVLYSVMKEKGLHEGCIEQITRLFGEKAVFGQAETDGQGLIRLDDWELKPEVQAEVERRWEKINTENVREYADIEGYWEDFYQMFGFHMDGVDYEKDLDPSVNIPSIPDAE